MLFLLIQVVPFGQTPSNPPVTGEPAWDSPQTRALVMQACFDGHSNETEKPWYSNVAPISWAVSDHVESGRNKLNLSEFDEPQEEAHKAAEVTESGEMPPGYYTRFGLHSSADLSDAEDAELVARLRATPGLSGDSHLPWGRSTASPASRSARVVAPRKRSETRRPLDPRSR